MKYVASLDGLRAIAILAVLGFHAMPGSLRGGFTGVDVFFVLSGYLISSVILYDIRAGKFSMQEFYLRRIQRLLPNAVVMILATVALYLFLLLALNAVDVARHGLWAMFNLSNIYILNNVGGYWGNLTGSVPLLHTWSLAVEEQFYLAFPITLLLLSRRVRLFGVTVGLTLASLALSIYGTWTHPTPTFYYLPTRAWEPLLGAALAAYLVPTRAEEPLRRVRPRLATEITGWGGLAIVIAGFLFIAQNRNFPGVIALVPTIGSLLLLVSIAHGEGGPARLLSKPFPVMIGKLSYSLYLWHWPLIVIGRTYASLIGRSERAGELIGATIGIALGVIAYWTVERPLRQRGPGRQRRLLVLAASFSLCVVVCLTVSMAHPIADPLHQFDRPAFYGLLYSAGNVSVVPTTQVRYADVLIPQQPHDPALRTTRGIVHTWGNGSPRLVVLGSSHALMYGKLIDDICKQLGLSVAFLSADATPVFFTNVPDKPAPAAAESFDAARIRRLKEWNPDAVFVIDRWDSFAGGPAEFDQQLRNLFRELVPHTRNVIVFSQVPVLRLGSDINLREYVAWYFKRFGHLPEITPDPNESSRKASLAAIEAVARDFPTVRFVRVDPLFYRANGTVSYSSGRSFLYADDNHLSDAGAEITRDIFTQAIVASQTQQLWVASPKTQDSKTPVQVVVADEKGRFNVLAKAQRVRQAHVQ